MIFVAPTLLIIFAAFFMAISWSIPGRSYLTFLAYGYLLCGLGLLTQIAWFPPDGGLNVMQSSAFYISGVLCFVEGIVQRSRMSLSYPFHIATFLLIVSAIWYFYYIDRSITIRVFVLSGGFCGILLVGAWRSRLLRSGSYPDRILYYTLVILALHFILRLWLTAGAFIDSDSRAFAGSPFWLWFQISAPVLGSAIGLMLIFITGREVFEELRSKSNKDALTQLLNRRGLAEQAVPLVSNPSGFNACVLICDIDHFKQINDRFGHAVGDEVLEAVARIVSKAVRKTDIAARIGGEEFVIVLSYSTIREAFAFAERLRTAIANSSIPPLPPDRRVTVSIGIAAYDAAQTLWQAIDRADKLLYKAKQAGRNRTFAEGGYTSHLALIA